MASARRRREWPTLIVATAIHLGWLALTWWHASLPTPSLIAGGGWLIAWHGSLQHETIHGHPTRSRRLNAMIGGIPLSLWLPYANYRRTHLAHHRTPAITDPLEDPESRYLPDRAGCGARALAAIEATLLGRVIAGPPIAVGRFLAAEAARAIATPRAVARDWSPHMLALVPVVLWLRFCGFGIGRYALCCVWPGLALTLLRSFAEHRADPAPGRRVAIVEHAGPLALLYLNNNLHAAHHRAPALPWYALPAYHARHRAALVAANGGLVYRGYRAVAARYLLRPHDRALHPGFGG